MAPPKNASNKQILVVGAGFVGLATAVFLATKGYRVTVHDKNQFVVDSLNKGKLHFKEPRLQVEFKKVRAAGRITVTTPRKEPYQGADFIFIAIDSADQRTFRMKLEPFRRLADWIGSKRRSRAATVVMKSTNALGFAEQFRRMLNDTPYGAKVHLAVNPEFLREGLAFEDTAEPARLVIGANSKAASQPLIALYQEVYPRSLPLVRTDLRSAELIKLGANLYLAHRLAFVHELATYAELAGLQFDPIRQGIGLDPRIGLDYFKPGLGFGGSCLPKDCHLVNAGDLPAGFSFDVADTALTVNDKVLDLLASTLRDKLMSLKGRKIALLGIAFKEELDDTRNSRAVALAQTLKRRGAKPAVFDPMLPDVESIPDANITLEPTLDAALTNASAIIIGCAHKKFRSIKPARAAKLVRRKIVVDRFHLLNRKAWEAEGFSFI